MNSACIIHDENYLRHWGIKGQKWGVRRFQNEDGTRTAAGKKREAARRDTDSMSDDELRNRVNRLQNEQNYRRIMSDRNRSKVPSKLRAVSNVMQIGGSMLEVGNAIANTTSGRMSNKEVDQNKTMTKEQKERYKEENKWIKDRQDAMRGTIGNSRRIADETSRISDKISRSRENPKVTADLKKMSDAELKKRLDRLFMEEQYDRLMAPQRVSKGERFVNNVLPVAASVVGIAGGIASLVSNINTLRKE